MRVAILLAAGSSRRFGRPNKLLAVLRGRSILLHALDRARESGVGRIIVVTGADRARIGRVLRAERGLTIVHAADHTAGMGASLGAGLAAIRPIEREALIFLGDMPFAALPRALRIPVGRQAVRPIVVGRPGHPMLMRTTAARAARLGGDRGLGAVDCAGVVGVLGNLVDIDSPKALRRARHQILPCKGRWHA